MASPEVEEEDDDIAAVRKAAVVRSPTHGLCDMRAACVASPAMPSRRTGSRCERADRRARSIAIHLAAVPNSAAHAPDVSVAVFGA